MPQPTTRPAALVNDVHSRLNPTRVAERLVPRTLGDLRIAVGRAAAHGRALSVAGGRHAMGGQQFGTDTLWVDTSELARVLAFDRERGTLEVEAGIRWPELVAATAALQAGEPRPWVIAQKQTGADRLSIGGALAANVHGRGLTMRPFVADVDAFTLVDAGWRVRRCSRGEDAELFRLAAGGYGLFGLVYSVTLRLVRRRNLERVVELVDARDLMDAFDARIAEGCPYGDFQLAIDERSDGFLRKGILSCYRSLPDDAAMPGGERHLSAEDWSELLYLAHTDKTAGFERYAAYYLATDGQRYHSDTHQLGVYLDDYHRAIDRRTGAAHPGSEVITELYVPRDALVPFLDDARAELRHLGADLIYGTIRLIERDAETFLAWAREPWACVVLNLHVEHTPDGRAHAAAAFRRLIDLALRRGGSYYLTYHKHATRAQVEAAHPRFAAFLEHKRRRDPDERFQSDWYRHHVALLAR